MRKFILFVFSLLVAAHAHAAEIRVLSAGAVQEAERPLAAEFAMETGHTVVVTTGTVGAVRGMLDAGEAADVIVVNAPAMEDLIGSGVVRAGTDVVLGRIGIGVAVRTGVAHPNIATVADFQAAVLAARSIVHMDPARGASSGIAMARIFAELGIADQVAGKTILQPGGYAADRVVSGEAELALQNMSELIAVEGVELVGPLPAEIQTTTTYVAGVAAQSAHEDVARALIEYMTRADVAQRWRRAGIEPGGGL